MYLTFCPIHLRERINFDINSVIKIWNHKSFIRLNLHVFYFPLRKHINIVITQTLVIDHEPRLLRNRSQIMMVPFCTSSIRTNKRDFVIWKIVFYCRISLMFHNNIIVRLFLEKLWNQNTLKIFIRINFTTFEKI